MTCVLSLAALSASAAGIELARLMNLLSQVTQVEAPYTEKKYSSLLNEPLTSSGMLVYRRPDTVEKNMTTPRNESYRFAGEDLVVVRNGAEKRYPLQSQPLLASFAASLRGVLAGDQALLQKHYKLALEGEEEAWHLDLVPLDQDTSRYVAHILVSGRAGQVQQIEVRETSGDRSVLTVR
jgi:hypothetical protein